MCVVVVYGDAAQVRAALGGTQFERSGDLSLWVFRFLAVAVIVVCVALGFGAERATVCVSGICVFNVSSLERAARGGAGLRPPWFELVAVGIVLFTVCVLAQVTAVCAAGGGEGGPGAFDSTIP